MAGGPRREFTEEEIRNCPCRGCSFCQKQFSNTKCQDCHFVGVPCQAFPGCRRLL